MLSEVPDKERGIGKCVAFARNNVNNRVELSEKQLSKLKDLHRMADHWYQWCHDVLNQPEITPGELRILKQLADMSHLDQLNVFLVDGELTELPKNPEYYRVIQKNNRQGGAQWEKRPFSYRKRQKDK